MNVSYAQVAVFNHSLEQPFNAWTKKHVQQGFAWRPESVSFRTIEEAGLHSVDVIISSKDVRLSPGAVRIIQVPFKILPPGDIEIASISDAAALSFPEGIYNLRFECFAPSGNIGPNIRLVFSNTNSPSFKIYRADADISLVHDLLLTADPA